MGFWDNKQAEASANMMDAAVDAGVAFTNKWREKRLDKAIDEKVRNAYLTALEAAKQTGEMPEAFQQKVGFDLVGAQYGIKAVALRELGKAVPAHPMVVSPKARDAIATLTLIAYNRADRPNVGNLDPFVPSDQIAQAVFKQYPQ